MIRKKYNVRIRYIDKDNIYQNESHKPRKNRFKTKAKQQQPIDTNTSKLNHLQQQQLQQQLIGKSDRNTDTNAAVTRRRAGGGCTERRGAGSLMRAT